jgi:hypothetical protein
MSKQKDTWVTVTLRFTTKYFVKNIKCPNETRGRILIKKSMDAEKVKVGFLGQNADFSDE